MTTTTFTSGNMVTTIVDLTCGLGGRSPEEILALTKDGAVKEYSEVLPDGRTITYSLEVEEELFEEEEDIEIVSSKTVTTCTLHDGRGVVGTARNIQEGEEITVKKTNSKTVSREEGVMVDIIRSEEREGGSSVFTEYHKGDASQGLDSDTLNGDRVKKLDNCDRKHESENIFPANKKDKSDENFRDHGYKSRLSETQDEVDLNSKYPLKPVTVVSENGVLVTCL